MRYLNEHTLREIGVDWKKTVDVVSGAVGLLRAGEYSQPIKPYLRFKDLKNRIIAMPAYIGGSSGTAGIKWIASFPDNITRNEKRAHAVVILNDEGTGKPYALFNTPLISSIRTAAISAYILDKYLDTAAKDTGRLSVGIIGFGPIGQMHLEMVCNLQPERIGKVILYDKKGLQESDVPEAYRGRISIVNSWQEVFDQSDVLITCTVSSGRYINLPARKGTLHLNVSLRDYCAEFMNTADVMVVDSWEEVCRENTDIEHMHLTQGLTKDKVLCLDRDDLHTALDAAYGKSIMFNPMGMAVFDMAISRYYYELASQLKLGVELPD